MYQFPAETIAPSNQVKSHYFPSLMLTRHLKRDHLSFLIVQDWRDESIVSTLYFQNQTNTKQINSSNF